MNILCTRVIPLCMVVVLLILLYWMIRLDKFHDYKYTLREYWKWIKQVASDIQRKLGSAKTIQTVSDNQSKITVIDLENNRQLGQALSNSDKKRTYSIRLDPSSTSLKRKNSIEYTIQINSVSDQNQNNRQPQFVVEQPELEQPQQAQQNILNPPSNDHLNLCFYTTIQVNTILPKGKLYQPIKEPITRGGLRHSTDYFKMYMEYEKRSRTELISNKNARSNQNLDKRVSFSNLCEINGVKTIRDLIKEGA